MLRTRPRRSDPGRLCVEAVNLTTLAGGGSLMSFRNEMLSGFGVYVLFSTDR